MTASAMKMSVKKCIRAASNLLLRTQSHSICQMLGNFSGVEFLRTVSKFRKKEGDCFVFVLHKMWNQAVSCNRHSCATTAKKCRKQRDACAKLLFCQFKGTQSAMGLHWPGHYFCQFEKHLPQPELKTTYQIHLEIRFSPA